MKMKKMSVRMERGIMTFWSVADRASLYGGLLACVAAILFIILPALSHVVFHCP